MFAQRHLLKPFKKWICKVLGTWSDNKRLSTVEFFVSVVPSSSITLSKVYNMKTSDKAVFLQSCFLELLPN